MSIGEFNLNVDDTINSENIENVVNYIQSQFGEDVDVSYEEVNGEYIVYVNGEELFLLNDTNSVGQIVNVFEGTYEEDIEGDNSQVGQGNIPANRPRQNNQVANFAYSKININLLLANEIMEMYDGATRGLGDYQGYVRRNYITDKLQSYYLGMNDNSSELFLTLLDYINALSTTIDYCIQLYLAKDEKDYQELENICNELWGALDERRISNRSAVMGYDINEQIVYAANNSDLLTTEEYVEIMEGLDDEYAPFYEEVVDDLNIRMKASYEVFLREKVPIIYDMMFQELYSKYGNGISFEDAKGQFAINVFNYYTNNQRISSIQSQIPNSEWENSDEYGKAILLLTYDNEMYPIYESGRHTSYNNAFTNIMKNQFEIDDDTIEDDIGRTLDFLCCANTYYNIDYSQLSIDEALNKINEFNSKMTFYRPQINFSEHIRICSGGSISGNSYNGREFFATSVIDVLGEEYIINYINMTEGTEFTTIDEVREYSIRMYHDNEFNDNPLLSSLTVYDDNGRQIILNDNQGYYAQYEFVRDRLGGFEIHDDDDAYRWFMYDRLFNDEFFIQVAEDRGYNNLESLVTTYYSRTGVENDRFPSDEYNLLNSINYQSNIDLDNIYNEALSKKIILDQSKSDMTMAAAMALDTSDITPVDIEEAQIWYGYSDEEWEQLDEWQHKYLAKLRKDGYDIGITMNLNFSSMECIPGSNYNRYRFPNSEVDFYVLHDHHRGDSFSFVGSPSDIEQMITNGDLATLIGLNGEELSYEIIDDGDESYYSINLSDGGTPLFRISNTATNSYHIIQPIVVDEQYEIDPGEFLYGYNLVDLLLNANGYGKNSRIYYAKSIFENQINDGLGYRDAMQWSRNITNGETVPDDIINVFESFGYGTWNGLTGSTQDVWNFFFADGKKSRQDYRNMYLMELLTTDQDLFIKYRNHDPLTMAYIGDDDSAYRMVLSTDDHEISDDEIMRYQRNNLKPYEVAYRLGIIDENAYLGYLNLDNRKDSDGYVDFVCDRRPIAGFASDVYNFGSSIGGMIVPLALAAIPYVGQTASLAWTFLATTGSERERLLQSGKPNDGLTFLQAAMKGILAVGSEKMLGGITGIGDNAGRTMGIFSRLSKKGRFGSLVATVLSDSIREVNEELFENFAGYGVDFIFGDGIPSLPEIVDDTVRTAIMTFLSTPFINFIGGTMRGENYFHNAADYNVVNTYNIGGIEARYSQAELMQFVDQNGNLDYPKFYEFLSRNNRFIDTKLNYETMTDSSKISLYQTQNTYTPNISEDVKSQVDSIIPVDMSKRNDPIFRNASDLKLMLKFQGYQNAELANTEYGLIAAYLKQDLGLDITSIIYRDEKVYAFDSSGKVYEFEYSPTGIPFDQLNYDDKMDIYFSQVMGIEDLLFFSGTVDLYKCSNYLSRCGFQNAELVNTEYGLIAAYLKQDLGIDITSIMYRDEKIYAFDSSGKVYEFEYEPTGIPFDQLSDDDKMDIYFNQFDGIKTVIRFAPATESNLLLLLNEMSGYYACSPEKARVFLQIFESFVNNENFRSKYKNELISKLILLGDNVRSDIYRTVVLSQESNGVTYEVCGNSDDTTPRRVANVQEAVSLLPPYLQEELKGKKIIICSEECPDDLYWRVKFDNPTHKNAADAALYSDGTITFWRNSTLMSPKTIAFDILSHELFHDIDGHDFAGTGLVYSDTLPWIQARNIDGKIINSEFISYGENNNHENFAEAGRYFTDTYYRERLRTENPRRYVILECFERALSNPESLSYEEKLDIIRITGSPDIANRLIGLENCPPSLILESLLYNAKTPADAIRIKAIINGVENDSSYNVLSQLETMDSDYANAYRIYWYKRKAAMNGIKTNSLLVN